MPPRAKSRGDPAKRRERLPIERERRGPRESASARSVVTSYLRWSLSSSSRSGASRAVKAAEETTSGGPRQLDRLILRKQVTEPVSVRIEIVAALPRDRRQHHQHPRTPLRLNGERSLVPVIPDSQNEQVDTASAPRGAQVEVAGPGASALQDPARTEAPHAPAVAASVVRNGESDAASRLLQAGAGRELRCSGRAHLDAHQLALSSAVEVGRRCRRRRECAPSAGSCRSVPCGCDREARPSRPSAAPGSRCGGTARHETQGTQPGVEYEQGGRRRGGPSKRKVA